ncbi:MAG: hypothetical protein K6E92_11295 [Lachnospiraceae bacterium]|nr:hypothetical protein [Lachnospiraceae bacterium]
MKYENARDILPASLLEEVQKYAEGKVIYIPKREKTKGWGEASGYREKLNKRNALICSRYAAGTGVLELAEEFYLSPESVKKIVYGKKITLPEYAPSVTSAGQYADAGIGEEWVRIYLEGKGVDMPDASAYFLSELVRIPLRLIEEAEPVEAGSAAEAEPAADGRISAFSGAPLIIVFEDHRFRILCGAGALALLRKEKRNAHWAFVFVRNEEYGYYLNNFGKPFQRGK